MTDINDMNLLQEVCEVSESASAEEFFQPKLPDDGDHLVILRLGNRGIKVNRGWEGKGSARKRSGPAFLNVHVQLVGLKDSGEEAGTVGFDNLTSIAMGDGQLSSLHAVMELAGFPLPRHATLGDVKLATENALAQNPTVVAVTRWEAQVNRGTKDAPDYKDLLKGQKNFPPLGEGHFNPEVSDPESGQTVRAQARVVRYKRRS